MGYKAFVYFFKTVSQQVVISDNIIRPIVIYVYLISFFHSFMTLQYDLKTLNSISRVKKKKSSIYTTTRNT